METGFLGWHLYTACRLTFTHFYEVNDHRHQECGTGFVAQFPPGDSRFALVTNRHLADIPWAKPECEGTKLESVKIEMWQSDKFRLEFTIDDPEPAFHEDNSIDVAVIPFGPQLDQNTFVHVYDSIDKMTPDPNAAGIEFKQAMPWEYLLTCEALWPDLRPGELVAFPGYPAWYDKLQ